jgi:23S rRNA (guanosine2251-2'-O)-methyltransferase
MKECILVLENLRSVENTASIFRTADGLGVKEIILVGTTPTPVDRFDRMRKDFTKVSLGAEKIKWRQEKGLGFLKKLEDYQIISLEQTEGSMDLKEFKAQAKFVLIVGNEVDGVSKVALDMSSKILEIKMQGDKESLNVSVAAGLALYMLI